MDSYLRIKKKYLEERGSHVREGEIENSRRRRKEELENEEERWENLWNYFKRLALGQDEDIVPPLSETYRSIVIQDEQIERMRIMEL
ncbi:hypothetical protein CsSME_00007082 [Camellia sinensis var. sinensis]